MSECIICGRSIGAFEKKVRTADGYMCSHCASAIPDAAADCAAAMSTAEMKELVSYEKRLAAQGFDSTASFGKLLIDESHGTFCFDSPKKGIFHCLALTDFSIYLEDPRAFHKGGHEGVIADIYMRCTFAHPMMSFKVKLEGGKVCESKRKNDSQLIWKEPGRLTVIRSMFYQMIRNENEKYTAFYDSRFISKQKVNLFRAEAMFMLPDGYDEDTVTKNYRKLSEAFGQDSQDEIDEAYGVLISSLKKKKAGN